MDLSIDLAERIKSIREAKRLKLSEIAEVIGVDVSNYAKIEKKGEKLPLDRLAKIADALGVSLAYLLGMDEKEQNSTTEDTNSKLLQENELLKARMLDKDLIIKYLSRDIDKVKFLFQSNIEYMKDAIGHQKKIGTYYYIDAEGIERSIAYSDLPEDQYDTFIDEKDAQLHLSEEDEKRILTIMFNEPQYRPFASFLVGSGMVEDDSVLQAYRECGSPMMSIPYGYYLHLEETGNKILGSHKTSEAR